MRVPADHYMEKLRTQDVHLYAMRTTLTRDAIILSRVDRELADAVRRAAEREDRSVSDFVRLVLRERLDRDVSAPTEPRGAR
jgi:hypothetical protein